jgi:hypothetical protein
MLSIRFTEKERSVDQRIEKATIGPSSVEFTWHYEGEDHTLDLPKTWIQMLIGCIKKEAKIPIACEVSSNMDRHVSTRIEGDCVLLDYAENGTKKTERLSVKSLLTLKAFLSDK